MGIPPPGDDTPSYPDADVQFDRLGVRIPTLLISPWVPKGLVLSEPPSAQKPADNSEYSLTSIIATTRKLLGMTSGPLTKRDAWSATFEQVFNLTEPRSDCPLHLPAAPPPSLAYSPEAEAKLPINGLQETIMTLHANLLGEKYPEHVKSQGQMSEWAQDKFRTYTGLHQKWKAIKSAASSEYGVIVSAGASSGWFALDWVLNAGAIVPFNTLSVHNNTLCLDYNTTTLNVTVSPCYPSYKPDANRDVTQQWVWGDDAMVRSYSDPSLCLTTYFPEGNLKVYLRPCVGSVEQHFAWEEGKDGNSGSIRFGPFSVGVVAN